jgi:biotin carboxyl carrier protein
MVSKETKDYCWGLYGKSPAPIDKKVQEMVLKGYEKGEKPIECRAADILKPELEKATKESQEFARNIQDVLTYALFPTTGSRFLKYKYGIDKTIPDDWKPPRAPKTLEEVKKEDELIAQAKAGKLVEKPEKVVPERGPHVRTFNVFVDGEHYQVEVDVVDGSPAITVSPSVTVAAPSTSSPATKALPEVEKKKASPAAVKEEEKKAPPAAVAEGTEVLAPMPGMIINYLVNVGDKVKAGDTLLILEAMKMQNTIVSPVDGVVKTINFRAGSTPGKNDILAIIA